MLAGGTTAADVFTYTLSDGTDEDLGELTITVTGTNNAPTGSNDSKPVNENDRLISLQHPAYSSTTPMSMHNLSFSSKSNQRLKSKTLDVQKRKRKSVNYPFLQESQSFYQMHFLTHWDPES